MILKRFILKLWFSTLLPLLIAGSTNEDTESARKWILDPQVRDPLRTVLGIVGNEKEWLLDPVIREPLEKVLGINGHPLAVALSAFNKSALHDDPELLRCISDTLFVLQSPYLVPMKMKDASVKLPDGLLEFAFTHLGNWDECVSVRNFVNGTHAFNGQMCLVNYHLRTTDSALSQLALKLGMCLPSTCASNNVQKMFQYVVEGSALTADVSDFDCTTQDKNPMDATDWTAVGLLIFFGLVIVLSTIYDLVAPDERKSEIPAAFSVISNGRKLLAGAREGGDKTLSCLHGIRFLSMCWVVLAHRYGTSVALANTNPAFALKFFKEWLRIGISNSTLSVDTFLLLSGLLVGYLFFKQPAVSRRLNLPLYYLHRYIRLTPALAMMVLLSASLIDRVNWGPLWPQSMRQYRENCRKNWWNTLLYVNNYVDPDHSCVGVSWYLMVDMQLHWLSPLVILPMARAPNWAAGLVPLLTIIGLVTTFLISLLLKLPANMYSANPEIVSDYLKYIYVPSYTRFVPYLFGLSLGYLLGNRQARNVKPRPLPFLLSALSWIFVAALMLVPLFLGYEFLEDPLPSNAATALYNSLHRPIWAAGLAGMVFLCANGNGGPVNVFLSWAGFQILGIFSYCIFLIHTTIQLTEVSAVRTYNHLSDEEILAAFAGDLLISILCAGVLSVTCESPFLVLEKKLLGGSRGRRVKQEPPKLAELTSSNDKDIEECNEK